MDSILNINEPDALVLQPWLIKIISTILDDFLNTTRNVAFSIRDIGISMVANNFTREGYSNGTDLREFISEWTENEFPGEQKRDNLNELSLLCHHAIGPEKFGALGDILDSIPWQVDRMYFRDYAVLKIYENRLFKSMGDADQTVRMLNIFKKGFEGTLKIDSSFNPSIIHRLASSQLINEQDLAIFNGIEGGPISVDGSKPSRDEKVLETLGNIWNEINNYEFKTRFANSSKPVLTRVGGLEGVKNAMIAGARLIKNLNGSVGNAKTKCSQMTHAFQAYPTFKDLLPLAFDITLLLNQTDETTGVPGYIPFFKFFSQEDVPTGLKTIVEALFKKKVKRSDMTMDVTNLENEEKPLFQDLDKLVTTDESYQEVFLAMQMLLEIDNLDVINAKCQFIDSFYSGLEYIEPVIEAFGVSTQDIRKWNEATIFVDALVQLLKESRSHENLMKFLAFHGKFTTVKDDPSASLELIGDIIVYLNKKPEQIFNLTLILGLVIIVGFASGQRKTSEPKKSSNPFASKKYNNPLHAEFDEPSAEALADLNQIKDLNVLYFYIALDELYLTGGFAKTDTINNIILSQKSIPDDVFQLLITTLRLTRRELKNGDSSFTELNSQLEGAKTELTKNLFTAVKKALRNATETTDDQDSFIQRISELKLSTENDLDDLNARSGDGAEALADLLEGLKKKISSKDFETISEATRNAFSSGLAKLMRIQTMLDLFKNLQKAESRTIAQIMKSVANARYRAEGFRTILDSLQNDNKMVSIMKKQFGVRIKDQKTAALYRTILEQIGEISVDTAYLLRYVRSVITITETRNYRHFMDNLVEFTQLSRDNKFRDVWKALEDATRLVSIHDNDLIALFSGLNGTVTGSYEEIFLALNMLLEGEQQSKTEAKCQFINEFFTGLSDTDGVIKAIGIPVAQMHKWMDSTEYVDALVDLLKASETFDNLNQLLDFHGKYTTVDKKPLKSMDLIDNFIVFLEQNRKYNRKNPLFRNGRSDM
eukprot:NP_498357.1 Uncharacterized protein CELE_T12A2.5 [Caenorhabditis elegans]